MSNSGRLSTNGSGNHDYPAASSSLRSRDANAEAPSNPPQPPYSTLFDNVLPRFRARQSASRHSANSQSAAPNVVESTSNAPHHRHHMSSRPDSRQRMRNVLRSLYDITQELEEAPILLIPRNEQSAHGSMRAGVPEESRPRAHPSGRFHRPRQERVEALARNENGSGRSNGGTPIPGFHEVGERLAQVNEDARNLLDRPIPLGQLEAMIGEGAEGHHRRKRARLQEKSTREYPVINYGHYGQVVPGKLLMELVSTDGGVIEPNRHRHSPENLLKDDLSVYCTQSPRCNIVLRHMGGTTFSLDKLVIKAPKRGYTDPVREGLIFVAMRKDELFDRTMRYRIYHLPTSRFASATNSRQSRQDTPDEDPYGDRYEPQRRRSRPRGLNEIYRSSGIPPVSLAAVTNDPNAPDYYNTANPIDCSDSSDSELEVPQTSSAPAAMVSRNEDGQGQDETVDVEDGLANPSRMSVRNGIAYWSRQWNGSESDQRQRRPPTWAQRFRPRRFRSPSSSDYHDMLQQIDFDEVLRRGETTSADRRSRRQAMQARTDQQIQSGQVEASVRAQTASDTADPTNRSTNLLSPVVRFSIQKQYPEDELDHDHEREHESDRDRERERERYQERQRNRNLDHDPYPEREAEQDHDHDHDHDHIIDLEHYHEPDQDSSSTSSTSSPSTTSSIEEPPDTRGDYNPNGERDRRRNRELVEYFANTSSRGSGRAWEDGVSGGSPLTGLDQIRLCTTESNKITIHFDPPLSGKYILLKLWSPKEGGNIDIERVAAYGFAGVRWFPCSERR